MRRLAPAFAAAVTLIAGRAAAEAAPPDGWTLSLGAIARLRPTHLGAQRYTTDAFPIIELQYRDKLVLSLDDGAKWNAVRWKRLTLGPIAEYRQGLNDDLPRRARKLEDAIETGGFVNFDTGVGELEFRLRKAVTGYGGWSGDATFDTGLHLTKKLDVGVEAKAGWADEAFVQAHFGLKPPRGRPAFPEFDAGDYYTAGGQAGFAYAATPRLKFTLGVDQTFILGRQGISPTLQSRSATIVGVGISRKIF